MKYFENYSKEVLGKIFFKEPEEFSKKSDIEFLKWTLGAQLITPMINKDIAKNVVNKKYLDLITNVWDLEDGAGEISRNILLQNLKYNLSIYNEEIGKRKIDIDSLPNLFIRVKDLDMLKEIEEFSEKLKYCNGIVIPKIEVDTLEEYLKIIKKINQKEKIRLFALPVLESESSILVKDALDNMLKIKEIINDYKNIVLNINIGATDFSGMYGIRRKQKYSIYDLLVVSNCISNILNIFTYKLEFSVTAPVWEYFNKDISSIENQGLLKEVEKDKNNGMYSKISIHPTQLLLINTSYIVDYEEYMDAIQIIDANREKIGCIKSENNNKMNELNTHTIWANNVLIRSKIFGVFNKDIKIKDAIDLLYRERENIYNK